MHERKATDIACGAQRQIKERDGSAAKECVLVSAVLQSERRAAEFDGVRNRKRAEIVLRAVIGKADDVVQGLDPYSRVHK
jgi:hypothetical protein